MEGQLQRVVGEHLRAVRLRAGLSQEKMGERLNWHRTYVGGIERGERNLTLRSVERLAEFLGVDPLALLTPMAEDGAGGEGGTGWPP